MTGTRFPNLAALLAIAAMAATTAAASLTTLSHVKDYVVVASLNGRPLGVSGVLAALGAVDLTALVLAGAAAAWVAWLEWRRQAVTALLRTATGAEAWALLTILVAWFGHSYLGSGVPLGGDTGSHVSRFLEVARGLDAGTLSGWTNYQYAGAPLLWFTGPLTYMVGGAIAWVVRDAVVATKIVLFSMHMLSGWLYFAFLRRLGVRAMPAVVVAAGFAGSFAHLHLFLFRGVIPQALTLVFLVMLFHAADGLMRGRGARWANGLMFGLATAGLIVNHQPHALFAAAYLAVFGAAALLVGFWHWRGVPGLVAFGLLGAAASVAAVLPVVVEADWVMIEPEGALFGVHLPTARRLLNLVLWRNTRTTTGIDYWAYLGLGFVGFGAAGLVGLARRQLRPGAGGAAIPACVALALCLVLFNPVVRDVVFILFFVGILAALGLDWLLDSRLLAGRRLLAAVVVAVADLASTSVQPVLRNDKGFLADAGRMLEQTAPNERVIGLGVLPDGRLAADMGPGGGVESYYSTIQRVAGNHNMAATRAHNYLLTTAQQVEVELSATGALSPETRALLALFNVGHVVCNSPVAYGCPASLQQAETDPVLGRHLTLPASPALFSQRLVQVPGLPDLEKPMLWPWDFENTNYLPRIAALRAALRRVTDAEGVQPGTPTVGAVAVWDAPPTDAGPVIGPAPQVQVRGHQVTLNRVGLQIETNGPGWVQLAHPWFPSTVVTVNGQQVTPLRGTLDLMVVPVAAGVSTIGLQDGTTPIRRASVWVSLAGLGLLGAAAAWLAWQDRRRRITEPQTA